tara:strand:- start:5497 stop:5688 length:192 start_codon:yes stop_codon:yes gene_type:complete
MGKKLKVEILNKLSSSMSPYAATQWLKKPLPELNDKIPSDILKKGKKSEVDLLFNIVSEIVKK